MSDTTGVWAVMGWWAYPLAVFPDELAARRWADEHGDGEVYWWPWGTWDNATKDCLDEDGENDEKL